MAMKYDEQVESIYQDEISSKKNQMYQYKSATKGRRLGKGNMRFASDFMSKAEKKKYTGAGEIMTTNMYDNILTIAEFNELETHEKKNRLQYWRTKYSNKDIQKAMGIANSPFYKIVEELNLPKAPRTERKRTGTSTKKKQEKPKETSVAVQENVPEVQQPQVQQILVDGLNLVFHGTYSAEQIQKQLKKFSALLEDEPDNFYIEFRVMQKQPTK